VLKRLLVQILLCMVTGRYCGAGGSTTAHLQSASACCDVTVTWHWFTHVSPSGGQERTHARHQVTSLSYWWRPHYFYHCDYYWNS